MGALDGVAPNVEQHPTQPPVATNEVETQPTQAPVEEEATTVIPEDSGSEGPSDEEQETVATEEGDDDDWCQPVLGFDPKKLTFCNDDHRIITSLVPYAKTFFTEKGRKRHKNWPWFCVDCKNNIWDGSCNPEKVPGKWQVHLCQHVSTCGCKYCLCSLCYDKRLMIEAKNEKGEELQPYLAIASPLKDLTPIKRAVSAALPVIGNRSSTRRRLAKKFNDCVQ